MKCECGKNAKFVLTEKLTDGTKVRIYYCKECDIEFYKLDGKYIVIS